MIAYVLDASVAAKWFLPSAGETLTDEALRLLKDYAGGRLNLSAPDLFWPEFGNILWKAARQGRISPSIAKESVAAIGKMGLATVSSSTLLHDAFAMAAAFDRPVYDAMYVALAVASGADLITADQRLVNALGTHFPVRWLGVYDSPANTHV